MAFDVKDAMWMVLTGKRSSAEEARRISPSNEVVPRGTVLERAKALAREILETRKLHWRGR